MNLLARLRRALPEGRALPEESWQRRHRGIRALLFIQAAGLVIFAIVRGYTVLHALGESSVIAGAAVAAGWRSQGRKFCAIVATLGLVSSSALLVHFSGGTIEAHFHFFVMLSVITLYQDWTPFLLAIGFVVFHHGMMGAISPLSVYNHPAAWANPWRWALIHGLFVLAASIANLVAWRLNEIARAHAEQALEEQRRTASLLTATVESTADGILVVDTRGKITSLNRAFAQMWRIPDEILASGNDDDALAFVLDQLEDPEGFLTKVRELYADADAESFDVLEFKDGRVFERYSQPQRVDGTSVGRVWSFRDVTQHRRLDQLKNDFLTAVSHELRTPLTAVVGFAATLQRHEDVLAEADRREILARLSAGAEKLQRLLGDILDLDRLSRGLIEPRRNETDVAALVRRVADEVSSSFERAIDVDAQEIVAHIDAAKVERIVENLALNAIRHTKPGTPIWIRARAAAGGVVIAVEDAGPGVPDDLKRAIFESFRQGPSATPHSPGVGIGLSLVARFADLHGGRAWVEDRPGGGASFWVSLPDSSAERSGRPVATVA